MPKLIKLEQVDKDIIDYIKQARIAKGLTQTKLAKVAGISLSVIGTSESYRQKYSNFAIKKLLKALDLEPPEEKGFTEKISSGKIDLFPYSPPADKIKLLISDKFIDNPEDITILQFKNKGSILVDKRGLSKDLLNDFNKYNQNYYAVIINDDSIIPVARKGDYLIIKFDKFAHDNFLITEFLSSRLNYLFLKDSKTKF